MNMIKKLWTPIFMITVAFSSYSQCSDLFFSEYIEGSSSNKALEIYNPTNAPIALSDYVVYRANNGSTTPTDSIFIQGIINPTDVFVISNPSANLAISAQSDTTHSITFYNGDDAVILIKISTGDTLDLVGEVGVDPGSGWPVGSGATNNFTLIRMINIQEGNSNWTLGSTEWDVFPINTADSLGAHTMVPCCISSSSTIIETACDSYTSPSGNYVWTSSNTYVDTIPNTANCDSVITINLTINNSNTGIDLQTACDSLIWIDGNTYYSSNNTATHILTNAAGCDSTVTLDLTINNSTTGIDTQTACDSLIWIDGNTYYSSNNTATHILTNAAGCDSTVTLDLTINNSTTGMDTQTACDSLIWIDGNTYYSSNNTATHILTNAAGCDSTVTLDLAINNSTTGMDTQTACDSLIWIDGNTYYSSNNTATHILTNAAGCDSTVTLDLTINNSTTGMDTQTACDSLIWIDGNTYYSSNNTATHILTNTAGCDSTVTLDLTINNSTTGMDTQTACDSLIWIDGNTYYSSNNTATHILTNAAGCDSTVTLDLTINNSTTGMDTQTACDSLIWIDGNTYYSSNNTATHILTNAAGCDSTVTLNLTIDNISDITVSVSEPVITANNSNATYQWLDCDNNFAVLPGETDQTFTAGVNGNYAVQLSQNGCVDTTACVSITTIGILENQFGDQLVVHPNPTNGNFSIDLGEVYNEITVNIIDLNGRLINSHFYEKGQLLNLSIQEPSGIYFISIQSVDLTAVIRLMKN